MKGVKGMADVSLNTNVNNAITSGYNQKSDIQRTVAVGVGPEDASAFNATVMSGRTAVRPVNNNESKPNSTKDPEKESLNNNFAKEANKDAERPSKSIQLEFDKATGYPVIKFRDTKGNVVSQVPPEQFLKMRSVLGYNRNKEEVVENNEALYSKKVGGEERQEGSASDTQKTTGFSKDNNLSLYV